MAKARRHPGTDDCAGGPAGAQPDGGDREQPPHDADVTRLLNKLFADPELAREQLRTATELDAAGTGWGDEDW